SAHAPLFSIQTDRRQSVPRTSEMQEKITALSTILDSIIQQTSCSNLPESEQALTQLERQQLIALLETALSLLRSTVVESSLLEKAGNALSEGAMAAAKAGTQEGLMNLMTVAAHRMSEIISAIFPTL